VLGELAASVYTIEIVPELAQRAMATLKSLGSANVHVRAGDGFGGWPEQAPFDRIMVTAAPEEIPEPLLDQLAPQGRLVIPVGEQGAPQYLEEVTAAPEEDEDGFDYGGGGEGSNDLYDQAVAIVTRDGKASTSYIQRRLQIGYNRAASLMERMEDEGVVGPANHAGKREILAGPPPR